MESKWLVDQKRKEVKARLRQILSPRGATTQAAVAAQTHRATVSTWKMEGKDSLPTIVEAGLICERFGVSLDQLYSGLPSRVKGQELPERIADIVTMMLQVDENVLQMVRNMLNGQILMQSFQSHDPSEQKSEHNRDS